MTDLDTRAERLLAVGLTYRAIWPIEDPGRPTRQLVVEAAADLDVMAAADLDVMAAADEARIIGEPVWYRIGDRLVCEAPAIHVPLPEPSDIDEAKVIRACRGERMDLTRREIVAAMEKLQREHPEITDREIAARLHRSVSGLRKLRERRAVAA